MTSDVEITQSRPANLTRGEARELLEVARLAARVCGARTDEVDDVTQIVVEKLIAKWNEPHVALARSRAHSSWQGYVTKAARNALKDARRSDSRSNARERRATIGAEGEPLPYRPGVHRPDRHNESDVDAYLARIALIDTLHEVDLTEREREVLMLHFIEGCDGREIAARLLLSARRIREVRRSGLRKIRTHVEKEP